MGMWEGGKYKRKRDEINNTCYYLKKTYEVTVLYLPKITFKYIGVYYTYI